MRLIDADALMQEFAEFVRDSNNSDFADVPTWNDAVSLLGSAPTIDPRWQGQWIPCSERLPEKDGYYLTTTMYRQVYRDYWNGDNFDRTEMVIAWMPLPEPYNPNDFSQHMNPPEG